MNPQNKNPYPQQPQTNPNTNPQPNYIHQSQQGNQNNYQQPNTGQKPNPYPQQPYSHTQQQNLNNPGSFGTQPNMYNQQQFGTHPPQPNIQGYANPYGQQPTPNYNPYQPQQPNSNTYAPNFQTNNALRNVIMSYADSLFMKYDQNRSGFLDVKEIYNPVCELFQLMGSPTPTYPQVLMIMQGFDTDRNGLLDINEFRRLLFLLNGINA